MIDQPSAAFRLSTRWPIVVAALLGLAQAALFYPGIASYDIVFAYGEAMAHAVGDWHPPVLIRLWQGLASLGLPGLGSLYLIQTLLLWLGLGLLAAAQAREGRRWSAALLLLVGVLPPVSGWMAEVLKDTQLTAALIAATGLVGCYRLRGRPMPWPAVAGVALLLLYATLLRQNALFSTLPLAAGLAIGERQHRRAIRPAMLAGGLALLVALLAPAINHRLFEARPAHAERSAQLFDMAGIAHFADLPTIPGVPPALWAEAERRGCYTPYAWDSYDMPANCPPIWAAVRDRPLTAGWLALIARHPIAYAEHRLAHFNTTLRFLTARQEPRAASQKRSTPNPWGLGLSESRAAAISFKIQSIVAATPLGWPVAWAALGLSLLWVAAAMPCSPRRDLALTLAMSALVQMASFLVVSVAADFRYHHWPIAAIAMATALLAGEPLPISRVRRAGIALLALCLVTGAARLTLVPHWPAGF
ncbi:hypothetical protein [Sphingomonas sp. PR090111-T3T-6A]|uniref:hypothetical protein n=1 Tax=Sphingomonas sp. PR090111-T3T-6A TaxID=685778 RepID=UPI000367B3E6|nr:hypothetical protein [Sphingomonas sp. PR090111-T3T-6A]